MDSHTIYDIVKRIPKGKVMTYGQIAKICKTGPRVVGNILHKNPDPNNIPCHRVVNRDGKVAENYAFGGREAQIEKLAEEVIDNRINLNKYQVFIIKY